MMGESERSIGWQPSPVKHHSNDNDNNSVIHEAEGGSNKMDHGWGREREHDIPILFLTSSIEDVEKSNFIINNALLSIRVFFGKKNVSSARRGDASSFFSIHLQSSGRIRRQNDFGWTGWSMQTFQRLVWVYIDGQSHKIIVRYKRLRAHRHHQRQQVCILVGMQPVQPVRALDFFEYAKQQKMDGSSKHEGWKGSRSLQVWTSARLTLEAAFVVMWG